MTDKYISSDCIAIDVNRPWLTVANLTKVLETMIDNLGDDYEIGSNSYLRNGIFMAENAYIHHCI